jgi:membrane protease YdiL (CAAX protease family)
MSGSDLGTFRMDEVKESVAQDANSGLPQPDLTEASHEFESAPVRSLDQSMQHPVHIWFVGPRGLRPVWRLLLYVVMWRIFALLLDALVSRTLPETAPEAWQAFAVEVKRAIAVLLPAVVMAAIEKRPFGAYGLPRRGAFGKPFWIGILWGVIAITVLVLSIGAVGDFSVSRLALHGVRILKFAAFWGLFFVIVGFFEEFLMRGYSQFTLTEGIGFWPSALLLSMAFAAMHVGNPGETWIGLLAVAAIGLFFCLTLRRTGNLWFAVGFHASWDWGESYLYSVPDSGGTVTGHLLKSSFHGSRWLTGGSVGPEGSVMLFVVIALTWLVFDRMYPRVKYQV